MAEVPVVTIDGPAASGKGTVARRVAQALGWHYLDSGALYRLVALKAMPSARLFSAARRRRKRTSDPLSSTSILAGMWNAWSSNCVTQLPLSLTVSP